MNNLFPTPEQCLELRKAGFNFRTKFWYVRLHANNFLPDKWYNALFLEPDTLIVFHEVEPKLLRVYGTKDENIIEQLPAPTLEEITIPKGYKIGLNDSNDYVLYVKDNCMDLTNQQLLKIQSKTELEARVKFWIEAYGSCKECNSLLCEKYGCQRRRSENPTSQVEKCPRNCVEKVCNEQGCQENMNLSPIKKPKKSDYGWENPNQENEGGWMIEGGEEAYNEAFELWMSKLSRAKPKETSCNGNCGDSMCDEHGCQDRKPANPHSIESTK